MRTSIKHQAALVTIGCFMVGAPMPPKNLRHLIAVIVLTDYPKLLATKGSE